MSWCCFSVSLGNYYVAADEFFKFSIWFQVDVLCFCYLSLKIIRLLCLLEKFGLPLGFFSFFFWFPVFSDILHLWTHPFFPPFFCRIPFCFTIVLFLFLVLYFYFAIMTFFFSHCLFGCSLSAMLLCELDDCCPYIFFILACKFYVMCVREELLPSFLISINTLHASFCFLFHFFMFAFSYFLGFWLMLSHLLTIDFGFFFFFTDFLFYFVILVGVDFDSLQFLLCYKCSFMIWDRWVIHASMLFHYWSLDLVIGFLGYQGFFCSLIFVNALRPSFSFPSCCFVLGFPANAHTNTHWNRCIELPKLAGVTEFMAIYRWRESRATIILMGCVGGG